MLAKTVSVKIGEFRISDYYKYVFLTLILVFFNSIYVKYPAISLFLGILETLLLIYFFFCKSISKLTSILLFFLSANIESAGFALGDRKAVLYSIYNLPIVKSYLLLLILLLSIVKCFPYFKFKICKKWNGFLFFYIINVILAVTAVFMSAIVLILNDNGMLKYTDMWRYMARDGYEMIHIIAILTLVYYSLKSDPKFAVKLKNISLAILSGITWSAVLLILCGNYYNTWGTEYYLTCPLIFFFAPGLILFLFEEHGIFHLLTAIIAILIQIKFTLGITGTWWIYLMLVGVVLIRKLLGVRGKATIIPKLICLFFILAVGYFVSKSDMMNSISGQISYKLSRILHIFRDKGDFISNFLSSGDSMNMRIEEIVNAVIEIVKKPIYLLFGKGYGGTVLKHWGESNWNVSGSTFSDIMIKYRVYSHFHISLAEIIINFGLVGIALIIFILKEFLAEFFKNDGNMWIVLGILWFVFFYSLYYSFNLGIAWICYGLYIKYEVKREENQKG